ncbi:YlbF family regulator [Vagococcus elongatus]|uniref:Uncharacterized protein n=1 Tax=Vagococcus elongatus TaxID=180344 RepID=A0A430APC3_9ENTE|nr:YlbF family regulator [Vagococcus elongatus]RSU10020.1 hypothetical protein CBF29_10525 [Vagococcus elongatus]
MEPAIEEALNTLLDLVRKSEVIQEYQKIEQQAKDHPKLQELIEAIKTEQKNAVAFSHYDKPVAEQSAIKKADELAQAFDEHPLVVTYREKLILADDLLQHMTRLLENDLNRSLEQRYQEELKKLHERD